MGNAQSSFLRVEPFAALFCLSAFYLPPPDPAGWPGMAPPQYIRVHQIFFFCEFQKEEYGVCLPRVLEEEIFFFLHHPPIYAGSLKFADFENFHSPRKKYF